ncbi:MAG: class I SAM-dependent methyltransferase [Planctomycetes bacterium]|nr:class I SAM-dependent methyltransferase [Planctomycetota bacterium]
MPRSSATVTAAAMRRFRAAPIPQASMTRPKQTELGGCAPVVPARRRSLPRDNSYHRRVSDSPAKDFGPIRDDYAFFELHSDEAEADLAQYREPAAVLRARGAEPLRLCDFGCGPGGFSTRFLRQLGCPPARLQLTLVEPQPLYRDAAAAALAPFTARPIAAHATLPDDAHAAIDLIVANHCLYYVTGFADVVPRLLRSLAPGGALLAAFAGRENALLRMWDACFALLGEPMPYHTAEDLDALLSRSGRTATGGRAQFHLRFPDSTADRWRILRFLLAERAARLPAAAALALFDPYARAGHIDMPTEHRHFEVRG